MNKNIQEIKNYFTEDVKRKIREVSNEDMKALFRDLEGTPLWYAILRYVQDRTAIIQESFLTMDPLKEASKISQYQGISSGIWDLPDAVLDIKFASKKAEDPANKVEDSKNDLGGAYGKY